MSSLNLMRKISQRSNHKRYLHAALIFSGSRLLAYGYNDKDRHAEIMAIGRLKQLIRPEIRNSRVPNNLHLISFMQKRCSGNMGSSEPCSNCQVAIREIGIKKITYFNSSGEICQITV